VVILRGHTAGGPVSDVLIRILAGVVASDAIAGHALADTAEVVGAAPLVSEAARSARSRLTDQLGCAAVIVAAWLVQEATPCTYVRMYRGRVYSLL